MSTASLLWSVLFGSVGAGYLVYGRKQRRLLPFACGLALIVVPYFISNSVAMVAICAVLMAIPFVLR